MHGVDADRPLLLIIRTGHPAQREYLLASIHRHYRVHIISGVDPTWERPYVHGWTRLVDNRDPDTLLAQARRIHAADPVSGVFCWDEARIAQAAHVAAGLGLPGPSPGAVARCRDKHRTRLALAAAGVPQPRSVRVDTVEQALAAAATTGYPAVLKPSDLVLSMGVVRVDDPDELARHFPWTYGVDGGLPGYQATVLLEEYVAGEEISVDAVVHDGRVTPLVLARKQLGWPPYCVEVGHVVDGADPLLDDPDLVDLLRRTHEALGFTDGVTHTELKLTPDGPRIIEVNGRIGGGLIPYLGLLATGVDTGLAAAAVACGRAPTVARTAARVAGVRYCYVDADDTVIDTIAFDADALPTEVDRAVVLARPGERRSPPPKGTASGRVALVTAVAGTVARCRDALDTAAAALRVTARDPAGVAASP